VAVKLPEPQFEGQTKTKLGNTNVGRCRDTVNEHLMMWLEEHPSEGKRVVIARASRPPRPGWPPGRRGTSLRRKGLLGVVVAPRAS
jgi:DNA gyrase subunit B